MFHIKNIFIFFIILSCSLKSAGQSGLIIPWRDTTTSDSLVFDGLTNTVDDSENVYVIGTLYGFDPTPKSWPIEGTSYYGQCLLKIDKSNNIVWKTRLDPYHYPAINEQLIINGDKLYVPYIYNLDPNTFGSSFRTIAGILLVNTKSGDIVRDKIFYEDTSTSYHSTILCSRVQGNQIISIDVTGKCCEKVLDLNLNTLSSFYTASSVKPSYFLYDSATKRYLCPAYRKVYFYDTSLNITDSITLPNPYNTNYDESIKVTINANFYAFNYNCASIDSITKNGHTTYLTSNHYYFSVYDNKGNLISTHPSAKYTDMLLTKENNFIGIISSNSFFGADTSAKPITVVQTDLFQNIIRQYPLGSILSYGNKLSVTSENELVISGSMFYSNPNNWLFSDLNIFPKSPDCVYYYKENLSDIPALRQYADLCSAVTIYPNPARNTINVSSSDFNFTYNAAIELYNITGQKLCAGVFNTQTVTFDASYYPASMYFIKIRNGNNATCVIKAEKQ